MPLFSSRPRHLRDYVREFERPMVQVGGIKDCPSYHGVLLEVFADSLLLTNCRVGNETPKGVNWVPVQGSVSVDRDKVLFIQYLNGGPGT